MATLQLSNVVKSFDKTTIIHGVDLTVSDSEFVVFVGPSGCGKSTLLRIISGLEPATSGDIRIDGQRVNEVSAAHRGCSMVFQSYALYPHMSVYDNMAFGLENLGVAKSVIETKVRAAAVMLQLDPLLQRKPTQLSGGQRQRVAIGRSIVREPKLFLFDEPLSNLDAELRVSMRAEIRDLHARLGSTMIYVTHDQVEAMTMADKIVVLRAGRIEQVGSPLELYNRPCNQFVAGFIGSPRMNFVPVAQLPNATPGTKIVGIRPEHARLDDHGPLHLKVAQVEQLGSTSILHGSVVEGTPFELILGGQTGIQRGDTVKVTAPPEHLHCFDQNGLRL
ncbi:sn-glycerol-3-phosphate ABC transporter ATP-binding protein UgpC [Polaromonas sp.]|uniref:ABC transporter ATP-binding protein n=1 Tax=Polaromonas sp. TaxID=1869339 RepID=UPI00286A56D9|nr:sn-glycerol-3-phosphate ABC transporter ATP-binding protein UgpC [Polaromonas sp.]